MRQMKSILRRGTALFMACLLACACSVTAFAAGMNGADAGTVMPHMTIIPGDYSDDEETLTVHVAVNEVATDGVLTVTYDPTVLSIVPDDVTVTELAAMYSTNVTQPGELKIGFIIDETQDTGDIAILHFTVLKANAETGLELSAEVFDEEENVLEADDFDLYPEETTAPEITTTPEAAATTPAETTTSSDTTAPDTTTDGGAVQTTAPDVVEEPDQTSAPENTDGKDESPDTGNAAPLALGIGAMVSVCGLAVCTVARRRSKH